jgi:hypothetical protein
MPHTPGHTSLTDDEILSVLNNLGEQGSAGSYINQVYLGRQEFPGVKGTLRGKKVDTGKIYSDKTLTIQQAKALYLTDENLRNSWLQTLKKNGLPTDPIKARAVWNIAVDGASDWYATSDGTQKITPEQYLNWYAGGQKKKAPKPDLSRSVYEYTPEQIGADVDKLAQQVLGRTINDADKAASWYTDLTSAISKMASKGTVSQVKDVRNPKTGKLERITTQTPEFTKEQAASKIESTLKNVAPEDAERKKRSDFMSWMFGQIGGGN